VFCNGQHPRDPNDVVSEENARIQGDEATIEVSVEDGADNFVGTVTGTGLPRR
jgi:hypothetical protein